MPAAVLGMRGTGDWVPNQRPTNIRESILYLYPNGKAPLTAIMSKMTSSKVDDPAFSWFTQVFNSINGNIAANNGIVGTFAKGENVTVNLPARPASSFPGARSNPTTGAPMLGADRTSGYQPEELIGGLVTPNIFDGTAERAAAVAGAGTAAGFGGGVPYDPLYWANSIKVGHQVLLSSTTNPTISVNTKVIGVDVGNNSTTELSVIILEDPPSGSTAGNYNYFSVIGNINPEGGHMPSPISLHPMQMHNYTQIFRTSLSITRTARETRTRTENQYAKMRREALEMHSIEMEQAFLFGTDSFRFGGNGHPERTTRGIVRYIQQWAPQNIFNFANSTFDAANGVNVPSGYFNEQSNGMAIGQIWFNQVLEKIFRYGAEEKLMLCGNGAIMAINDLAFLGGAINIAPRERTWGLQIMNWVTPFGNVSFMSHPLFNEHPVWRNTILVLEPRELEYKYITDTTFYGENGRVHPEGYGRDRIDGSNEEFLTEAGLKFGMPLKCGILYNVNPQTRRI